MAVYSASIHETGEILECERLPIILKSLRKAYGYKIDHGNYVRTSMLETGEYKTNDVTITCKQNISIYDTYPESYKNHIAHQSVTSKSHI